jgi:hypothetical protein
MQTANQKKGKEVYQYHQGKGIREKKNTFIIAN